MNRSFKVYFDDTDAAGVMFFGNIYSQAHKSIEDYIANELDVYDLWFKSSEYIVPIRHSECEHLAPFIPDHEYTSIVEIDKVGESSVVFKTVFFDKDKSICAKVRTVHVFVSKKGKSKTNVPKNILDTIKIK